MKKITIKSLHIENFKGCRNLDVNFGHRTCISGANASGKTTICDAFSWLLFNKDSNGVSGFGIRPKDEHGKVIDNVEIKVSATLDINGDEIVIEKVQKQNWSRKRSTQDVTLQGNTNSYVVDTIPMKEKDYVDCISSIVSEDMFDLLTNPNAFVSLEWKKQREILTRMVDDVTDVDVAATDIDKFSDILPEIQKHGIDGLLARTKKALSEYKKKKLELPARIDELEKAKVDIDIAELELQKSVIKEQISDIESKEADANAQVDECAKKSSEINSKKLRILAIEDEKSAELRNRQKSIEDSIYSIEDEIRKLKNAKENNEREVKRLSILVERAVADRKKAQSDFVNARDMEFDESETICPNCGQVLPEGDIEKLKSEFEDRRKKKLESIKEQGNLAYKAEIDGNSKTDKLRKEITDLDERMPELTEKLASAKEELSGVINDPEPVSPEIEKLNSEIAELTEELKAASENYNYNNALREEKNRLMNQIVEIEKQIASADNSKLEEQIDALTKDQRAIGQLVANQERYQFKLEEFSKAQMDLMSNKINGLFSNANFILFKNQLNGGYTETCECEVNGVPYSDLNSGHKIVAGLDIVSTLQKMNEIYAPVFVDNAETINDCNIPDMDCQLITLSVTDGGLEVK